MCPWMQPELSVDVSAVRIAAVVGAVPTHRKILDMPVLLVSEASICERFNFPRRVLHSI